MKKKEINKNEIMKNGSKTLQEFKQFISRGNVIDMAVGVIIGTAFGKIVTSIVNDVLMPAIGLVIGGLDFTNLKFTFKDTTISYGAFIQNVVDFLIVAVCIFVLVKIISKFTKKEEEKEEVKEEVVEVKKDENIILLEEIRDLLKKQTENKK